MNLSGRALWRFDGFLVVVSSSVVVIAGLEEEDCPCLEWTGAIEESFALETKVLVMLVSGSGAV